MMQKNRYEQPKLELVSLAANDILLTSQTDVDDPNGELSQAYTVDLGKLFWNAMWN